MLIDRLDYPDVRYGGPDDDHILTEAARGSALPPGQYAFARADGDVVRLARDPLGCHKLFFGTDRDGRLVVANRIAVLWASGVPLADIASCPPGHVLAVSRDGVRRLGGTDLCETACDPELDVGRLQEASRLALAAALDWLRRAFAGSRFVVALSGGLDSGIVASLAAAHLPDPVAASFTYLGAEDLRRYASGEPTRTLSSASADFRAAVRVASALGMPLLPVVRPRAAVGPAVAEAVRLGQDWRDFNVHCATVNLFLAQGIRAAFPGERVVVLTGDLMNEYLADYREEHVAGTAYYRIPRVPADRWRRHLVRGLDAGDREIGVFWAYRLVACQPFAVLAPHYMRIPRALLETPDCKWTLNGPLLAPSLAGAIEATKTRAQVGGQDMGTLGIYHELGIDQRRLRGVWRSQFPGEAGAACDDLMALGRYRPHGGAGNRRPDPSTLVAPRGTWDAPRSPF